MNTSRPRLETSRLVLTRLQPEQSVTLARLADDPRIAADTANFPSPYTLDIAEAYIRDSWTSETTDGNLVLGIHLRPDAQLVGVINLRVSAAHHSGNFGYWIGAHARGQGLASEALIALMQYGFSERQLVRMQSRCFARNLASARTMEKAGLLLEGRMPGSFLKNSVYEDQLIYGTLRQSWPFAQVCGGRP